MARLTDGFPTFINFLGPNGDPGETIPGTSVDYGDIAGTLIWEREVSPPGMQGGGANDITTMRNTRWRTMAPKKLMTLGEMSCTFAYDPQVYEVLVAMMQVNQLMEIHFSDDSKLRFWGFFDELSPNSVSEGEMPDADVTIIPTNYDSNGNEVAPIYIEAS